MIWLSSLLSGLFPVAGLSGSDSVFTFSDGVPAGFESLAGEQTTFVDIRFNGRIVGSSSITGTDEWIRFDSPEAVTALLPGLRDPASVSSLLAEALPSNGDRVCFQPGDPAGCGQVAAEPVAVIHDAQTLTVDLFLDAGLQQTRTRSGRAYMEVPPARPGAMIALDGIVSALDGEAAAASFSARLLAGVGHAHLRSEADYDSRSDRRRLRSLSLNQQYRDHAWQLGSFALDPGGTLSTMDLFGLRFGSSLQTRLDLEQTFGSELVIYLPRRSLVQLVIDDRIYAGGSYDAGNQELDTRSLPEGSHEVEIRINDPVSGSRVERRHFTKSTRMPPRGQTIYQFSAGMPLYFHENRVFPESVALPVASLSAARRLGDRSTLTLGLSQFGDETLLHPEWLHLGRQITFQVAGSFGGEGLRSVAMRGSWSSGATHVGLNSDWLRRGESGFPDERDFDWLSNDYRQITASLSRSFGADSLNLRYTQRQEDGEGSALHVESASFTWRHSLDLPGRQRGSLQLGLRRQDARNHFHLDLSMSFGHSEQHSSTVFGRFDAQGREPLQRSLNLQSRWRSPVDDERQWQAGVLVGQGDDGDELSLDAALEHARYQASIDTQWNRSPGQSGNSSALARFSTQLGVDTAGASLVGDTHLRSALLLQVDGEASRSRYDILVNGLRQGEGHIGSTTMLGLTPYQEHTVQLLPESLLASSFSEDTFAVTLYPGMLQRLRVDARRRLLLVATLVDHNDELIQNARIDMQPNPLIVGESGFIQLEVSPDERVRVELGGGEICHFVVPDEVVEQDLLVASAPLRCLPDI